MKNLYVVGAILLVAILGIIIYMNNQSQPVPETSPIAQAANFSHRVTIETNYGTIVFETYDGDAPRSSRQSSAFQSISSGTGRR
jgi:hypothetical protein